MMRTILTIAALALIVAGSAIAQEQTRTVEARTTETQTTLDSTSGKVVQTSLITTVASSEDVTVRTNMIQIDPIKFFGLFNIGYQRAIAPTFSVGGVLEAPTQLTDAGGFGVIAEGRYYPGGRTFRGFHLSGTLSYHRLTFDEYDYEAEANRETVVDPVAIGVSVGWHWYPSSDFAMELGLGADYALNGARKHERNAWGYYNGSVPFVSNLQSAAPHAHIQIGYSW